MYSPEFKHYIFKKTSGITWHIFFNEKHGICYRTYDEGTGWSTAELLVKDSLQDYYAELDGKNQIHIVYQDLNGNINYLLHNGNTYTATSVLRSKMPSPYRKSISCIPGENGVNILFTVKHKDSLLLAHQFASLSNPGTPKTIDYVIDGEMPYSFTCSKNGEINVFYQVYDGKFLQLGTKKLNPSTGQWGEFTPITRYNGNCEYPKPLTDNSGTVHVCYQRQQDGQYEFVHQKKEPDKNIWSHETVIQTSGHSFRRAAPVILENNIIAFWIRGNAIHFSYSPIDSDSWSRPQKYSMDGNREIECAKYTTNMIYEQNKIISTEIPVVFSRGYKIAFWEEIKTPDDTTPSSQLKSLIVDSLNALKNSVDDLKKSIALLDERILNLESEKDYIKRELVKLALSLKDMESVKPNYALIHEQIEGLKKKNRELSDKIKKVLDEPEKSDTVSIVSEDDR
ncbi:MAG TPA: hypothetical protein GXX49_12040 [Clostridiaceae bacterium]|nr:hypothetical protein [Clostridiaceae bacterium]